MTATLRRLLGGLFGSTFGGAVLVTLVLAGWALWSGGVLDGPIARAVRASSVYVAPGVDLDRPAAERIIGNRRLVVLLMAPGDDLRAACKQTERAASGTLVLVVSRAGQEWDTYGCSRFPQRDNRDFGRAVVMETTISRGIDAFVDRPLEALKVVTLNYDLLVRAGTVPDGARTISPSLPRYLLAGARPSLRPRPHSPSRSSTWTSGSGAVWGRRHSRRTCGWPVTTPDCSMRSRRCGRSTRAPYAGCTSRSTFSAGRRPDSPTSRACRARCCDTCLRRGDINP
ncbi:hypothetical protein [Micromonospora maris]|uniref:hypothetical protein n=1 Tax=Micromonospora maris TaxID=1003110 RepID=UPI0002EC0F13|nr:hypothetical protein [Micromonospora maris]